MSLINDDELVLLWRQGASTAPDPEEIARLAGRASIMRFDRLIFWRNFREYVAGLVLLAFVAWEIVTGKEGGIPVIGLGCVSFILVYLWWYHRDFTPLDPSEDARAYQAAMLSRIDKQIRLLSTIRYWAVTPFAILALADFLGEVRGRPVSAVLYLALEIGSLVAVILLNERSRWGVPRLREERTKIERLYEE